MKKIFLVALTGGFISLSYPVLAQEDKKESQEIIIRKKGDKDTRLNVEIEGDKIMINGKPLSEFKDDEVSISKRKIIIRDGKGAKVFSLSPEDMDGFRFLHQGEEPHAFLGVTTKKDDNEGVEITNVSDGSAAEKAGLKEGDVIIKIDDKKIDGPESLSEAVRAKKPQDEVKIVYQRDGKERSIKATLGESKGLGAMSFSFGGPKMKMNMERLHDRLGNLHGNIENLEEIRDNYLGFQNNMRFLGRQKLGLKIQDVEEGSGVKVLDVDKDSPAEKAGLQKDDVITEVQGKKVNNTDEARKGLHENRDKSAYTIKAKRNGREMSFDIKIPKKLKTANL